MLSPFQNHPSALLFRTARLNEVSPFHDRAAVCYTQQHEEFVERNLALLRDYQRIFNLSEEEYVQLRIFMRFWQIIWHCCDPASYCQRRPAATGGSPRVAAGRPRTTPISNCLIYDTAAIEEMLVSTRVWQEHLQLVTAGVVAPRRPPYFDGVGFCKRLEASCAESETPLAPPVSSRDPALSESNRPSSGDSSLPRQLDELVDRLESVKSNLEAKNNRRAD
jgi:hypothetical protein